MIELKRTLAPVDNTPFNEINSFETDNYIGIYVGNFPETPNTHESGYIVMPKSDIEYSIDFIKTPNNLEELDSIVYDKVDEHINCVSTSRCLEIKICEDY